jgi:hypothetical protein
MMERDREMMVEVSLRSGNVKVQTFMDWTDDHSTKSWLAYFTRVYADAIMFMKVYENKADGKGWTLVSTVPGLSFNGYQLPSGSYQSVYGDMYTGVPVEPETVDPRHCHHEPKLYVGFTETYNYCAKCDKKLEST